MRNRYTSRHPDVIRLEKIIADLEAEAAAAPSAQEQAPAAAASNREPAVNRPQAAETRREIGPP